MKALQRSNPHILIPKNDRLPQNLPSVSPRPGHKIWPMPMTEYGIQHPCTWPAWTIQGLTPTEYFALQEIIETACEIDVSHAHDSTSERAAPCQAMGFAQGEHPAQEQAEYGDLREADLRDIQTQEPSS